MSTSSAPQKTRYPVQFGAIHIQNIKNLEVLTNYTFPISYSSNFYTRVVQEWSKYSCYAYLNDIIVGAITCRIDELPEGGKGLYVLTLATLEQYRRGQIATQLYEEIYKRVQKDKLDIKKIYLHTPLSNQAAIKFYEKLGFKQGEVKEDYYNALEDKTAVTLEFQYVQESQAEDQEGK